MLLKINNFNKKDSFFYSYYYSVYRNSLYSEAFYRLEWPYLRYFKRLLISFGKRYKKRADKIAKRKHRYTVRTKDVLRRKNRGSKVKGYFFKKKKIIINYKRFKKKKKKNRLKKKNLSLKQKIFIYQKFF